MHTVTAGKCAVRDSLNSVPSKRRSGRDIAQTTVKLTRGKPQLGFLKDPETQKAQRACTQYSHKAL
jgi:hypothetical protein